MSFSLSVSSPPSPRFGARITFSCYLSLSPLFMSLLSGVDVPVVLWGRLSRPRYRLLCHELLSPHASCTAIHVLLLLSCVPTIGESPAKERTGSTRKGKKIVKRRRRDSKTRDWTRGLTGGHFCLFILCLKTHAHFVVFRAAVADASLRSTVSSTPFVRPFA